MFQLALKPSFKKRPLEPETFAAEGGNVTMMCNPEAAPRPKFIWKKDGNMIGGGGRRRMLDTGSLIISPVSRDDEGTYVCQASNQYGSDESRGRLIVLSEYILFIYVFAQKKQATTILWTIYIFFIFR